jgi:hypothetical protein
VKKLHLILLLLLVGGSLQAQTNNSSRQSKKEEKEQKRLKRIALFKEREEGENTYERDFSVGGRLNTDGWGGFLEMGFRKNRKIVNYFQFEFSEKKDPHELKRSGAYIGTNQFGQSFTERPFIYLKQNNFYPVKLGMGQRYLIGGKGNKNGVEVSAIYYGGISVGLVKPYYVNMEDPSGSQRIISAKYGMGPEYDKNFTDINKISGGAGFGKGWSELKVTPGLHARAGMRFDWAHFNEVVSALEVGVNAEYYTKEIPIMVDSDTNKHKQFFFNAYVSLQFGKRWNKR